jgi:RsiW-degrading membrane proteinase PrsW (M82 family)
MIFEIVFLHLFALIQLYVVSFRSAVRFQALLYLCLVGALACAPAAIAGEYLVDAYFGQSSLQQWLLVSIEELAKAAPVIYLLYRTSAGATASLLDGVLYGAAAGAGFAISEDLLFTLENVQLPASFRGGGLLSVLTTWLPGGWGNSTNWFPGHLVLAAFAAALFILGRRLWSSRLVRGASVLLGLAAAVFFHACFNNPPDPTAAPVSSFLYNFLAGGGAYLPYFLLAMIVGLIVIHERVIRPKADPGPSGDTVADVRSSIFADLAALLDGLGKGWSTFQQRRVILGRKTELLVVSWEIKHAANPGSLSRLYVELKNRLAAAAESAPAPKPASSPGFFDWKGTTVAAKIFRAISIPILIYGFAVVFLTPFFSHSAVQDLMNTTTLLVLGLIGQTLLVWRLIYHLRNRGPQSPVFGSSESVIENCRTILTWAGALFALSAWKQLYDLRALPYPFHAAGSPHPHLVPADIHQNDSNLNGCMRGAGAPPIKTGGFAPIAPMPGGPGDDSGSGSATGGGLFGDGGGSGPTPPNQPKTAGPVRVDPASDDFGAPKPPPPPPPKPPDGPLGDDPDLPSGNGASASASDPSA